jgi:hypothetical protein
VRDRGAVDAIPITDQVAGSLRHTARTAAARARCGSQPRPSPRALSR